MPWVSLLRPGRPRTSTLRRPVSKYLWQLMSPPRCGPEGLNFDGADFSGCVVGGWPGSRESKSTDKCWVPQVSHLRPGRPRASTLRRLVSKHLGQLVSSPRCGPWGLNFDGPNSSCRIVAKAGPTPILRLFDQAAFDGIAMHIAQLFDPLLLAMHVEVVIARLPEWTLPALN